MLNKYDFKPFPSDSASKYAAEVKRFNLKGCVVEHVGSTAVPGVGGKGIIDIAIGCKKGEVEPVSKSLVELGYTLRLDHSTEDRWFLKRAGFHIHIMEYLSENWSDLLLFRDTLRQRPDLVEEYEELKKSAKGDAKVYRAFKEPFVNRVLGKSSH
ncbi:MAG: hypothetical protein SP1CHLAM54_11690 [Chlamydiia bacterium]|nr:hypothetical protein [Chlamydiia bacterium]MCH9616072.1 hypothetical protein [Chlamydiia bacterium]MCH9629095.1 hypothetical protein [Chlamydiia bacterium]